jgi:4-carboxymuconolactone decarboxylase
MDTANRYERGMQKLHEMYGAERTASVIASISDIAPDLARYMVEFAFGDVHTRPALDLKSREIATIASLTTLGTAPRQLRVHIHGALNVGCSQQEILEVILQMAVYAGFPAALNAMQEAREVFKERAPK